MPGATLVGPIPAEVQNYTVYGMALPATAGSAAAAARQLLAELAGAPLRSRLAAFGMESP